MPDTLTPTQLIAILLTTVTILVFAMYAIVKNWVNSVNGVVDEIRKYDARLRRVEEQNFPALEGQVRALMLDSTLAKKDLADYKIINESRLTRTEKVAEETSEALNDLRTKTASIETMVKEMWERRRPANS